MGCSIGSMKKKEQSDQTDNNKVPNIVQNTKYKIVIKRVKETEFKSVYG